MENIQAMILERTALNKRLFEQLDYIESKEFLLLPLKKRAIIKIQVHHMSLYSVELGKRISYREEV